MASAQIRSRRLIDLSGLVHDLNVVTVGVEYPGCVIVRMILELEAGAVFSRPPAAIAATRKAFTSAWPSATKPK
jgi:hypothetical protein